MLQYIIQNFDDNMLDIEAKFKDPFVSSDRVIDEVIEEFGFSYISDLADTLTGIDKSILVSFLTLLSNLKGSRKGLELVLQILGIENVVTEWFEDTPVGEPNTFRLDVFLDLGQTQSVFETVRTLKEFLRFYVVPILSLSSFVFSISVAQTNNYHAGFVVQRHDGIITGEL